VEDAGGQGKREPKGLSTPPREGRPLTKKTLTQTGAAGQSAGGQGKKPLGGGREKGPKRKCLSKNPRGTAKKISPARGLKPATATGGLQKGGVLLHEKHNAGLQIRRKRTCKMADQGRF